MQQRQRQLAVGLFRCVSVAVSVGAEGQAKKVKSEVMLSL